jgi:hypothetical protein
MVKDMIREKTTQTTAHLMFKTQGSTKQDLLKEIKRIGGCGDGGHDTIPHLLHQCNSDSKLVFQIAKKLTTTKFVATMNNKVEHQNNPSESVILKSTK